VPEKWREQLGCTAHAPENEVDLTADLALSQGPANWGSWQEMRMASEADRQYFVQAGLHPLSNARAFSALERLISTNRSSAIVASIDWTALRAVYEARRARPIFSEMGIHPGIENGASPARNASPVESEIRIRLEGASAAKEKDLEAWRLHTNSGFELKIFDGDHFFIRDNQQSIFRSIQAQIPTLAATHR
jgi:hypothetical protein